MAGRNLITVRVGFEPIATRIYDTALNSFTVQHAVHQLIA
jgi:hypothetical protein